MRYAYAHPVQNGVHLIPTTELTAYDYERRAHRVHLLCYWPDDCAALADFSAMMAERRLTAMLQSCKELEAICPQFRTEEALELPKTAARCSRHRSCGCCGSTVWPTACIIPYTNRCSPSPCAGASCTRRGMSRWTPCWMSSRQAAQWFRAGAPQRLPQYGAGARADLAAGRLDGVEIDHPRNTPEDRAELTRLAKENGLIVRGGTDYHGINTVTPRPVEHLRPVTR